jgi:hypothetical protein
MASPWWEFWATEMLLRIVICAEAVTITPTAKLRPNISLLSFIQKLLKDRWIKVSTCHTNQIMVPIDPR